MCGFAGIVDFTGAPVPKDLLDRMSARLAPRGPDGSGEFRDRSVAFCHRRLALVGGQTGAQPMHSGDGRWVIALNGECYNYRELRAGLEARGRTLRTRSDTEVVLEGFAEHGIGFVEKMNGDFAFAAFDRKTRELHLGRDRLGVKPLYWHRDQARIVFGSTIRALLEAGVEPALEETALRSFLALRYCPGPQTLFRGIQKVPPGTVLTILESGKISETAYWDLRALKQPAPLSFHDACTAFFELLQDSVKLRMGADAPVGAYLSGGVDSSSIVALMARAGASPRTFTMAMGGAVDESGRASEIARELGVPNTPVPLGELHHLRFGDAIRELEEPLGDSIIVPTLLLAEETSRNVKAVLAGEGADEILGGYVHHTGLTLANRAQSRIPAALGRAGVSLLGRIPLCAWEKVFPYQSRMGTQGRERVLDLLRAGGATEKYFRAVELFSPESLDRLLTFPPTREGPMHRRLFSAYWDSLAGDEFQNRLLKLDLKFWAADYNLLRIDKLSMSRGLEVRVPFFDHRLVELCVTLPASFKTGWLQRKRLLRSAIKPARLLNRSARLAPKRAFYLPVGSESGAGLKELIRDTLSERAIRSRGWMSWREVASLRERDEWDLIESKQIMALFLLETWARIFLDGDWKD